MKTLKHQFIDTEAEKAVAGWLCAGGGLEQIKTAFPDINEQWFTISTPIYAAAQKIEANGQKAHNLSIADHLESAGHQIDDPMLITPGHDAWSVVEYSLQKLARLYGKRCVSEIGKDMEGGMEPQEAIKLLEPLAIPQGASKLLSLRFDYSTPPPKAEPILSLKGQGFVTPGNLAVIVGQAKSGKSAILSAILAARMDGRTHLGIKADCSTGAVVHFDTEQSRHDHWQLVCRAMRRAEVDEAPDWLRSYSVASLSTDERRSLLFAEIAQASTAAKGVGFVAVDGIADLCHDPNDTAEAFGLVDELHRAAAKHDCGVMVVLHLNPGTQNGKSRGHLGSQLERKAESVLQLERDDDGVIAWLQTARNAFLPKSEGQRFAWDHDAGMFMPQEGSRSEAKAQAKAERERVELERLAALVGRNGPRRAGQFITDIMQLQGTSKTTAERRFRLMKDTSIIHQNLHGEWSMAA